MRIFVTHETIYRYAARPRRIVQLLRLTPDSFDGQSVDDWVIDLNCDADLTRSRDAYGNITHLLTIEQPPEELIITASGQVDTEQTSGVIAGLPERLPPLVYLRQTELSRASGEIAEFASEVVAGKETPLERTHALLAAIFERMTFQAGVTDVHTTATEAFQRRAGVCQDLSHLFCGAARSAGIPARYVSGHLYRRDGQNDQPAAHAWAEAYIEDLGWTAFDPAHGISADDHYVRVAAGPDYRAAAPIIGSRTGGGEERLTVNARTGGKPFKQAQSQSMGGGAMRQSQQSQ